jgi:ABC-type ATPase involved in cell division
VGGKSMYNLQFEVRGLQYDLQFKDDICFLLDNSGTGKTFLFSVLRNYCYSNDISCKVLDYNVIGDSEEEIINSCKEHRDILIFDNADLYLSKNILENVNATLIIASVKNAVKIRTDNSGNYRLIQNDKVVSVKRW